jgi:hypothetical protein
MPTVHVVAKRDFLESLTLARPMVALAELVWNGFDAQSDRVQIQLDLNPLGGLQTIRVRDYGYGINHAHIQDLFGSLGDSWKKRKTRREGRALHGKSGKGRFRAFALGTSIEWNTTFRAADGKTYNYRIRGLAGSLDDFEIVDPVEVENAATGTEVIVSNLRSGFGSLLKDDAPIELGKLFAPYLTEYPGVVLEYNGTRVDPALNQNRLANYMLGEIELGDSRKAEAAVTVVEWSIPTERTLHLCDGSGVALHQTSVGSQIRAPGFNFTAYIKSDLLRELDNQNQLVLEDLHPDVGALVTAARNQVKEHFRMRGLEQQGKIVERWKEEQVYPYESRIQLTPVEAAEQQVFDILALQLENGLASFAEADKRTRKLTFGLLAQALHSNAGLAQRTLGEILGLKKDAQDELAALLDGTPLASVLTSSTAVADRRDVLAKLKSLVADPGSAKRPLGRETFERVVGNDAWVFDEAFGLCAIDQRLEEVLAQRRESAGSQEGGEAPSVPASGGAWQGELLLHRTVQVRAGEFSHLIVERIRPSVSTGGTTLAQLQEFARSVAADPQFKGGSARWMFLAIADQPGNSSADDVSGQGAPETRRAEDPELNLTVSVKTWSEVLADAGARLGFVSTQLAHEIDQGSAAAQLKQAHAKFIPVV